MIRDPHSMPWIGYDCVFDLANTVVLGGGQARDLDFFVDVDLIARWREQVCDRRLAKMSVAQLSDLRELVRDVLDASDTSRVLPDQALSRLNTLAAQAPVTFEMNDSGELQERECGGDAEAVVARQTLRMLAGAGVRRCRAPSCGMFFTPRRKDQSWCTVRCGARVRGGRRQGSSMG
ncbi:ABATE domain-containing protein [Rhodococcus sp. IEGM 1318]|uniref:ABATE domain-containing protein n=1 Tax=Rhodococcus sp. IEGM 1318 TaxID=3082226 RepID=UPI00295578B7|nr:ABATE domain-containing protein [Rhodococcus sp. IEGM 1318]MDV8009515.1 ABATE domain-containing protein [Rhodococcus sp. IEGM 1318]